MTNRIVHIAVEGALAGHTVSSDFSKAPDDEVAGLRENATTRADANGRRTVQPRAR